MRIHDFSNRAEECLRLSQRVTSMKDRQLFLNMARAWYGLEEDDANKVTPQPTAHPASPTTH
jgi:hypothetical protein